MPQKGDTILIRPGAYPPEDVTIHKENVRLIGAGMDQVTILGRERVGVFIGKWPHGATNIEISGITVNEHGGHAMGMFKWPRHPLSSCAGERHAVYATSGGCADRELRYRRQRNHRYSICQPQAVMRGNFIHDNDHGVSVAGKSTVRLEHNVITRSLFEAVIVNDQAQAVLVRTRSSKRRGPFLGTSQMKRRGTS